MSNFSDSNMGWLYTKIQEFFDNGGTLERFHMVLSCFFENYKLVDLWEDSPDD